MVTVVVPGFTLHEEIGRGATSRVFRATQDALGREVALKVLNAGPTDSSAQARRLLREARVTSRLDHPVLVRGVDAGQSGELCWFAMELVEGATLDELVNDQGPLPLTEVVRIGTEICTCLEHIHAHGVVHRDLKPSNIMVDIEGRVRLLDLGLARATTDPNLTADGAAIGTPLYMAPEQARGSRTADPRSDIYGLGATLYRTLCGMPPFSGENTAEIITKLLYENPAPPSHHREGLAQSVDLVLLRTMNKEPKDRHQTATALRRDLTALGDGQEIQVPSSRTGHRLALVVAALVLLACGIGGYLYWDSQRSSPSGDSIDDQPFSKARAAQLLTNRLAELRDNKNLRAWDRLQRAQRICTEEEPDESADHEVLLAPFEQDWSLELKALIKSEWERALELLDKPRGPVLGLELLSQPLWDRIERQVGVPSVRHPYHAILEGRINEVQKRFLVRCREVATRTLELRFSDIEEQVTRDFLSAVEVRTRLEKALADATVLDAATRSRWQESANRIEDLARSTPRRWWEQERHRIRQHIESDRFISAEQALAAARVRVQALIPQFLTDNKELLQVIEQRKEGVLKKARGMFELPRRQEAAPLSPVERAHRVQDLQDAIENLPDVRQLGEVEALVHEAAGFLRAARGAARLHERVLEAAKSLTGGRGELLILRQHSNPLPRKRRLKGVKDNNLLLLDQSEQQHEVSIADLPASLLGEILIRSGESASRSELALCAYWDADPTLALEYLGDVADRDSLTKHLHSWVLAELAERRNRFDHKNDRKAWDTYLEIRTSLAHNKTARAEGLLRGLLDQMHDPEFRGRSFARAYRSDILRLEEELRTRRELQEAWAEFGGAVRVDPDHRRVELVIPMQYAEAHKGALLWSGVQTIDREGIALTLAHEDLVPTLVECPHLKVLLPELESSSGTLSFDVTPLGSKALGGIALRWGNRNVLVVGGLPDKTPMRGEALHGLERDLHAWRSLRLSGSWRGDLADYPPHMKPWPKTLHVQKGARLNVKIRWSRKGLESITVAGTPLFEEEFPKAAWLGGPLEIYGWPGFQAHELRVQARMH